MEQANIARSLTVLTRSGENSENIDNIVRQPSQPSIEGDTTSGTLSPASTRRRTSQASTPPQEDDARSHSELISGLGCLFDNVPLPRAPILAISAFVASTATSSRRSQTPEAEKDSSLLVTPKVSQQEWVQYPILTITPKAEQHAFQPRALATPAPTRTMSTRDCIVVQPIALAQLNLFTPDPSPKVAKRPASPPCAPRQAKRSRKQAQQVLGNFLLDDDLEDSFEPQLRKIVQARQRGAELTVASFSDASSQGPSDLETRSQAHSEDGDNDGEF